VGEIIFWDDKQTAFGVFACLTLKHNLNSVCLKNNEQFKITIMESFMRKLMNTAFGTASMARKRATEVINDLMEQEKISEEEGRRIIEELNKEGEEQRGEFEKEIKTTLEKLLSKMNIPSKKEFEALEKRVEKLENPNSPNI